MIGKDEIAIKLKGVKPTPLNRLYKPIAKFFNGTCVASLILSLESRETKKHIQMEVLRQKQNKMLKGYILFYMEIDVVKVKSPDADALLKQTMDALEGLCYKNDNQILDIRERKHLNKGEDMITIYIKNIET